MPEVIKHDLYEIVSKGEILDKLNNYCQYVQCSLSLSCH